MTQVVLVIATLLLICDASPQVWSSVVCSCGHLFGPYTIHGKSLAGLGGHTQIGTVGGCFWGLIGVLRVACPWLRSRAPPGYYLPQIKTPFYLLGIPNHDSCVLYMTKS